MFLRETVLCLNFIKVDLGMKRLYWFPRKNSFLSLLDNNGVEHNFPLICLFGDFLQVAIDFLSGNSDGKLRPKTHTPVLWHDFNDFWKKSFGQFFVVF